MFPKSGGCRKNKAVNETLSTHFEQLRTLVKHPLARDSRFGADLGIQLCRRSDLGPVCGMAGTKNQRLGPIWGPPVAQEGRFGADLGRPVAQCGRQNTHLPPMMAQSGGIEAQEAQSPTQFSSISDHIRPENQPCLWACLQGHM